MKAMVLERFTSIDGESKPLELVELPEPQPGEGEILIKVYTCGVCHTELDEIEGRVRPPELPVVPGHQVVGRVAALGRNAGKYSEGDRVGVGWIFSSSRDFDENISEEFRATGCDANGGYAEFMVVPEDYAYPIPENFTDLEAAPLLCAGAIGYRALKLAGLRDGQSLGLAGFGGSAHLVLPVAKALYPNSDIYVFARKEESREFALQLGAVWSGDFRERAPLPLQAIIDTTPAWRPVVESLANLAPGGRLLINAIRKESADKDALLDLDYQAHLWMEREVKSIANITGRDIAEFLPVAAQIPLRPEVTAFPLEEANEAIVKLRREPVKGAKVLVIAK